MHCEKGLSHTICTVLFKKIPFNDVSYNFFIVFACFVCLLSKLQSVHVGQMSSVSVVYILISVKTFIKILIWRRSGPFIMLQMMRFMRSILRIVLPLTSVLSSQIVNQKRIAGGITKRHERSVCRMIALVWQPCQRGRDMARAVPSIDLTLRHRSCPK